MTKITAILLDRYRTERYYTGIEPEKESDVEPIQYLVTTALRHDMRSTLAYSALPDAPVLPERRSLAGRIRSMLGRIRPTGRRTPATVVVQTAPTTARAC